MKMKTVSVKVVINMDIEMPHDADVADMVGNISPEIDEPDVNVTYWDVYDYDVTHEESSE